MQESGISSDNRIGGQVAAIETKGLTKSYRGSLPAVDNVDLSIVEGEIFGLLGPNGAGKTTTMKMIMTLTNPTSGSIRVLGTEVHGQPSRIRQLLGYVPQAVSADGDLTAFENLLIFAKLFYVRREVRDQRIKEALASMGLTARSDDLVKRFSGGMVRRLEIAQALVNRPRILLLDEPSIGLDPVSRRQVWGYIKRLNKEFKITVFITTHDMAEADELCDRLAIMNNGKIAILDSPTALKNSMGGDIVTVGATSDVEGLELPPEVGTLASVDEKSVKIVTDKGELAIPRIVDFFEKSGYVVQSISLSKPTLDDVFLKYTNARLDGGPELGSLRDTKLARRSFARHSR
jgi:ABC-2 type transport system ATP-binding protein